MTTIAGWLASLGLCEHEQRFAENGIEYRDLGTVALKGFTEDTPAWQVLGAGAAESRFEAPRATSTPLVGRDEEIDLLMRVGIRPRPGMAKWS